MLDQIAYYVRKRIITFRKSFMRAHYLPLNGTYTHILPRDNYLILFIYREQYLIPLHRDAGNRTAVVPGPENSIRKENVTVVRFETSGIINAQVGTRRRISHPPRFPRLLARTRMTLINTYYGADVTVLHRKIVRGEIRTWEIIVLNRDSRRREGT